MQNANIDKFILARVGSSPMKVARVIADAMGESDLQFPAGEIVAKRLELLVKNGQLTCEGDIQNWRYSEVHKP